MATWLERLSETPKEPPRCVYVLFHKVEIGWDEEFGDMVVEMLRRGYEIRVVTVERDSFGQLSPLVN